MTADRNAKNLPKEGALPLFTPVAVVDKGQQGLHVKMVTSTGLTAAQLEDKVRECTQPKVGDAFGHAASESNITLVDAGLLPQAIDNHRAVGNVKTVEQLERASAMVVTKMATPTQKTTKPAPKTALAAHA